LRHKGEGIRPSSVWRRSGNIFASPGKGQVTKQHTYPIESKGSLLHGTVEPEMWKYMEADHASQQKSQKCYSWVDEMTIMKIMLSGQRGL